MYNDERRRVGTRKCVPTPAWEPIWVAKASRFCGLAAPRRWHVENAFPRRRVGTRNIFLFQLLKKLCITMSAGAWEREKT